MEELERWYKEQYVMFLAAGLVVVLIEFGVLLSTILAFTKLCKHKQATKSSEKVLNSSPSVSQATENIYQRRSPFIFNGDTFTTSNSFRQNYKLVDKAWWWFKGAFMPYKTYVYDVRNIEAQSMMW